MEKGINPYGLNKHNKNPTQKPVHIIHVTNLPKSSDFELIKFLIGSNIDALTIKFVNPVPIKMNITKLNIFNPDISAYLLICQYTLDNNFHKMKFYKDFVNHIFLENFSPQKFQTL